MSKLGSDITRELEDILRRFNLSPNDGFRIRFASVDETLPDGKGIGVLFDEGSGLLMRNDAPVFAYIRDHSVSEFNLQNPRELKRLHFSVCKTLRYMERLCLRERYQTTNRDSGRYVIELNGGREHEVELYPCQNCMDKLCYKGFHEDMSWYDKRIAIKGFSPKEAIGYIGDYFRAYVEELRHDFQSAGYPKNWGRISSTYRASRGYVCEKNRAVPLDAGAGCGVNLSSVTRLADCHHINGVKSNCDYENLCCLCRECHGKLHNHYKKLFYKLLSEEDRKTLRRLRAEQGIDEIVSTPNAL